MRNAEAKVFEVTVPKFIFPGFYNTDFDPENVFTDEEKDDNDYITRYEYYQDTVLHNVLNHYRKVMPSDFKLVDGQLWSPREYNYRNDEIHLKISCTYEDILFYFFNHEEDYLLDYLELNEYREDHYPEAFLEVLLEFWPFVGDLDDLSLKEKFIYG